MVMFNPPEINVEYIDDYRETILMDFEFLRVPVAKNYDHALKVRYGEYMRYVKGPGHTGFFNTDISYIFFNLNSFSFARKKY